MSASMFPADHARHEHLMKLKAFGLFVDGRLTYYQIAQRIGIVGNRPDTAAGRARTRAIAGWMLVRGQQRWARLASWRVIGEPHHGARLSTVPYGPLPVPPAPKVTPFDLLMIRLADVETFALENGFHAAVTGIRNMRAALAYNKRLDDEQAKAKAASR
jgi:hypothetical protein